MRADRAILALTVAAACGGPRFLGARVGAHCPDYAACVAWADREIKLASPGLIYRDPALDRYVASVMHRLIRAGHLAVSPEISVASSESPAWVNGNTIYIARETLALLDSEAELAAVVAHELAHADAGTTRWLDRGEDADALAGKRAIETVADQRAVGMLVAAGYDPRGLLDMMDRLELDTVDDAAHPSYFQRRARVAQVIGERLGGERGRERYQQHVAGLLVGRDERLVTVLDQAVVSLELGAVVAWRDDAQLSGRLTSARLGETVVGRLTAVRRRAVGDLEVVTGVVPTELAEPPAPPTSLVAEALANVGATLPAPSPGAQVLVVRDRRHALWLESSSATAAEIIANAAAAIRAPTAAERARIRVARLRFHPAAIAGTYAEAAATTCADPTTQVLDLPGRAIRAGEPIKCADLEPADSARATGVASR